MSQSLKVGVLLCSGGVQLLDLAAVDLIAMMSSTYLRTCGLPETVVATGHEVKFHYIADGVKGEAPMEAITTADVVLPKFSSVRFSPLFWRTENRTEGSWPELNQNQNRTG
jgi:hypothetical protein